jgi:hypothetical protein
MRRPGRLADSGNAATHDPHVRTPADGAWWEHGRIPGVGAGIEDAIRRQQREQERELQRLERQERRRALAHLSRSERRNLACAHRRWRRALRAASAAHQAGVSRALARFSAGDEPRTLVDRWATAMGAPLWAEQPPHVSTSANAAAIYPFYVEEGLGHRGVLVGLNVTGGGAFSFDPWNLYSRTSYTGTPSGPRLLSNGNVIVIGAPGNGKSALVKTLCFRLACFGRRVECIDPKGEYGPLIRALGGVVIGLQPGGSGALNPLTDVGDPAARRNLLLSLARALLGRQLNAREEVGLLGALAQADRTVAQAGVREVCLPDVEAALRDPGEEIVHALNADERYARDELREVMLKLTLLRQGPLAGMFDRATSIPADTWDRRAVSIDLSAVARLAGADEHGQNLPLAITMMCCQAFLTARAMQRARRCQEEGVAVPRTVRVNDEGWRVIAVPGQAQQHQSDFKLQRATGVVNVLVMHRFSDLRAIGDDGSRARELAAGLLSDADTVVIYRQDESELPDLVDKVGLTDAEERTVEHLEPGQALWLVGSQRVLVHHLRSGREVALSDTDEAMTPGLPAPRRADAEAAGV